MSYPTPIDRHWVLAACLLAAASALPAVAATQALTDPAITTSSETAAQPVTSPQTRGAPATDYEDIAKLEMLAQSTAAPQLPPATDRQRLQVGPIQPRLQLPRCATGVESAIAPGLQVRGRVLVDLRCGGSHPWHLYVPVRVVGTAPVALAAHALVAGAVLTAKDVTMEQRDVTQLPQGYLDDPATALGLTATRPIAGGSILTNQVLMGAKTVQRGQSVTLMANIEGMSVRMSGRALTDGMINQRIRVENLSSGKIVEGIVRSEQVVEIVVQ